MLVNPIQKYIGLGFRVTSKYGYRIDPVTGKPGTFHHGTDLGGKPWYTAIPFWFDGVVTRVGYNSSYGNSVYIRSAGGLIHLMAHLADYSVKVGDKILSGGVIGRVGSTGVSTGPHIHYEIRYDDGTDNGGRVWGDPEKYYEEVSKMSVPVKIYDQASPAYTFEGYGLTSAAGTTKTFVELRSFLEYCGGKVGKVNYPESVGFFKPVLGDPNCNPAVEAQVRAVFEAQAAYEKAVADLVILVAE